MFVDVIIETDTVHDMYKRYWFDLLLIHAKKYLTEFEFNNTEIFDLYDEYDEYENGLLFGVKNIPSSTFNILLNAFIQAKENLRDSLDARIFYADFMSANRHNHYIRDAYENENICQQILKIGIEKKWLDSSYEPIDKKDFDKYIDAVLNQWTAMIQFLQENYGKTE